MHPKSDLTYLVILFVKLGTKFSGNCPSAFHIELLYTQLLNGTNVLKRGFIQIEVNSYRLNLNLELKHVNNYKVMS